MKTLVGEKFDKLIVKKEHGRNNRNERLWLCECDCGNEKIAKTHNLRRGLIKHCGCSKQKRRDDSIIGKRFHRLIVVDFSHTYKGRTSAWKCRCECGAECVVTRSALKSGRTKSCGCYNKEVQKLRMYNPDVPDEIRIMTRICSQYKQWVKDVKRKHNNECDVCSGSKRLVAHHIKNYLDNPDLRFNVDNGVCLCKACHTKFHAQYGLHNNTPRQYYDFKENHNEPTRSKSNTNKRDKTSSKC